jgi:amidase
MRTWRVVFPACLAALLVITPSAQAPAPFHLEETTIAQIEGALGDGSLTCRALVEQYLKRIDAYDRNGPALNAIVQTNADALKTADDLDRRFRQSGPAGPMHCVPVIVKDNYETFDMPTTAGSLSLKGMMTGKDAFVVKRLRDAGAVLIAKSNMAEFAFSPVETVNSILPGYTRNPYDTSRVTAGSSRSASPRTLQGPSRGRWPIPRPCSRRSPARIRTIRPRPRAAGTSIRTTPRRFGATA